MAKLRIQAPDGKTLAVPVPDGTDPSQYDSIVDDVMTHYTSEMDPRFLEGKMADGSREYPTTWQTEYQPAADLYLTADGAKAGVGLVKKAPAIASGIADGVSDIGGTIAELGAKAKGAIKGGWDALTGNTPRGFGYAQGAGATPEARALAKESIEMANNPQPELADLVQRAARRPIAGPPGDVAALGTGENGLATANDVANFPAGPGEAPLDLEKPDTSAFETPIRQGIMSGKEEMMNAAEAQRQQVGQAIENVLSKYDANGTFYDPTAYNSQIKSMLMRDSAGNVMTTGAQGQINEAIKEAGASMADFSKGGPIKWSDAAKVKTLMQGNGRWGQAGLSRAQEAYNTAATLLKEDIDKQAMEMLQKQGGNVQDYQQLRDAYSKLSSLSESLNVAAKRQFANSAIPWWVKMAAGATLAGKAAGIVKGISGH